MIRVLSATGAAELEVKKSRFLATAAPLSDPAQAAQLITRLGDPEARHNCWAWRHGQQYRFHDAGEPASTAGKPILAAIDGAGIDRALVVVTRHFGGIKLGAGGLVRAYGKAAGMAIKAAPSQDWQPMTRLAMRIPPGRRALLEHQLKEFEGQVLEQRSEMLDVVLSVDLPATRLTAWRERALQLCAGRVVFLDED